MLDAANSDDVRALDCDDEEMLRQRLCNRPNSNISNNTDNEDVGFDADDPCRG